MSQFWENLRTDGRTDGLTLFYRTLPAQAGRPKNQKNDLLTTMYFLRIPPKLVITSSLSYVLASNYLICETMYSFEVFKTIATISTILHVTSTFSGYGSGDWRPTWIFRLDYVIVTEMTKISNVTWAKSFSVQIFSAQWLKTICKQQKYWNNVNSVVLVLLLLTLNIFDSFF